MSEVIRSPFQAASQELITKLVKAGYLQPALRNGLGKSISGPHAWFTCTSYPARSLDQRGEEDEALE